MLEASWSNQMLVMLKKNLTIQKRSWKSTLVQSVGAPISFLLLLFLLQQTDYSFQREEVLEPTSEPMQGVFRCTVKLN